jgi:RND family efflux transporter MFP subunit
VVTSRNIDVGDLVDAGSGSAAKALFTVSQVDPLRLYIFVPQVYASQVKVGDQVDVFMSENREHTYKGTIARTARAIDVGTRTMQVEIQVPNGNGELISGSYVQARLPIKQDQAALLVPTNVLLFRPDGTRIAVVDEKGLVHLSLVKLGIDFGSSVAVISGLKASDVIVVNPPDSLAEGDVVGITGKGGAEGSEKGGG